ncbi:amidase [Nocardiopsis sp. CNT312]|uniref:amidase n=1 Tax=Nocardiopsis sp. CNT312 TaxID=1137268 RepID=UPI00048D765E|nr:amidase [Nocardiopsis sp. CNT312]
MTQIHDLPGHRLAAMVRGRELSPVEIAEHFLRRVERLDPTYGSHIAVTAEIALEQARYAEKRVVDDTPDLLPPLLGVPVPVKDLDPVAGVRTTYGSRALPHTVAAFDTHAAGRLRAAGALLTGKTNTPELGSSCYTENGIAPPTRNPWNTALTPGGSSGGAAAAVAARLAPIAHGTDGGGSVRIPASACGLFGLKPTRGRVSAGPGRADLAGLATAGFLTRTVADAALVLDAVAGNLPGDQYTAPCPPPGPTFLGHTRRAPRRLRIGRYTEPGATDAPVHPHVRRAHDEATELLVELGHEVEEVPPPGDAHFGGTYFQDFQVLWTAMASAAPVAPEREHELGPLNRWLRARARSASAADYIAAWARLQRGVRSLAAATAPFDAVLSPTLALPPGPIGHLRSQGAAEEFRLMTEFAPFTSVYNVSGQPSVSLPLHWSPDGLPIGVMLTGRPGGEGTLLSLSAQLEQACPWAHHVPPGTD